MLQATAHAAHARPVLHAGYFCSVTPILPLRDSTLTVTSSPCRNSLRSADDWPIRRSRITSSSRKAGNTGLVKRISLRSWLVCRPRQAAISPNGVAEAQAWGAQATG